MSPSLSLSRAAKALTGFAPRGDLRHPLQHRCLKARSNSGVKWTIWDWMNPGTRFGEFTFEFQTTGVKLAGALNGLARGQPYRDAAFTVVYLK
jgi:hypothetical protein